ncbi:unnamed protein product [Polarella glacialis]|uniref:Mitochondrial cardiolipin hydrolase n=1 Tax=Polarella glacialis TaxID=89957 RepID=A0A813KFV4_POLGL|nr:unnamed protein product [Polarella glacialis]
MRSFRWRSTSQGPWAPFGRAGPVGVDNALPAWRVARGPLQPWGSWFPRRFARLAAGSLEKDPRALEQWQWLSRGLEEALLRFIAQAIGPGWKLCCALYEAHYPPVLCAMAKARERGATVQLVVDWKPAAWSESKKLWTQRGPQHLNYWALEESGLLQAGCVIYRRRPLSAISHNKFIVLVSPAGEAEAVWTGSTNLTSGAIFGHSNVGHVLRDPALCRQYLAYWEKLAQDPEKKELASFNEQLSPLPFGEEMESWQQLAIFSPRLRWADALSFLAQLILGARQSVAFTAAFGIGREISPALLAAGRQSGAGPVPTYLLLESEGNWPASRDAVRELQRQKNVRVAFGMHFQEVPSGSKGTQGQKSRGWIPEHLTGLNEHVRYVHTKILLIDMFSDSPIVISGSANFSRASMESNDENMVLVRGNRDLSHAYAVEFFRIFEHMRYRNQIEATAGQGAPSQGTASSSSSSKCGCGQAVAERIVKKPGQNCGRSFLCCANPVSNSCGFFSWSPGTAEPESSEEERPWPQRCFQPELGFDALDQFEQTGQHAMGAVEGLADTDQADCCDNNSNADSERDHQISADISLHSLLQVAQSDKDSHLAPAHDAQ